MLLQLAIYRNFRLIGLSKKSCRPGLIMDSHAFDLNDDVSINSILTATDAVGGAIAAKNKIVSTHCSDDQGPYRFDFIPGGEIVAVKILYNDPFPAIFECILPHDVDWSRNCRSERNCFWGIAAKILETLKSLAQRQEIKFLTTIFKDIECDETTPGGACGCRKRRFPAVVRGAQKLAVDNRMGREIIGKANLRIDPDKILGIESGLLRISENDASNAVFLLLRDKVADKDLFGVCRSGMVKTQD